MVHVLFVAGAVVHIDELILVVFRAASAGGRTRCRTVLIAGFARFALLLLHALVLGAPILEPDFDLCFREVQILGQLFPLGSDHVVVALEGVFQFEQLRGREGRPDAFRFAERDEVVARESNGEDATAVPTE